jgi:hypothetical protein
MTYSPQFLDELRARLPVLEVVSRYHKMRREGSEYRAEDNHSLCVNPSKNIWSDFGANGSIGADGGKGKADIFAYEMHETGCDFREAVDRLAKLAGMSERTGTSSQPGPNGKSRAAPKKPKQEIVATFPYVDADSTMIYQVVRFDPKGFAQRRPVPGEPGNWIWGLAAGEYIRGKNGDFYSLNEDRKGWKGERRAFDAVAHGLYRFDELRELLIPDPEDPQFRPIIHIAEGEADCETLRTWGMFATTNSGGAGNWQPYHAEYLHDANVIVLLDNDPAGRKRGDTIAKSLRHIANSVRILDWKDHWPGAPKGGDVTDWRDRVGGTGERLCEIVDKLPEWQPPADGAGHEYDPMPEEEPLGASESTPSPAPLIKTSAEFIAGYVAPDYTLDGMLQQGFLYSLTGATGSGKTSITLRLAASTALGIVFAGRETKKGRVLYLVAENPDDARMRWIALAPHMGFDPNTIEVFFSDRRFTISKTGAMLRAELRRHGGTFNLVIIDTGPSFFEGDDENNRAQMGAHARMLRGLIDIVPGRPCIIVNCHPVKNPGPDNLLPAGGGSFLNEVDGNLTAAKTESTVELHWQGKYRGPEFAPLHFLIRTITHERLKDSKGNPIPTVMCDWISDQRTEEIAAQKAADEDRVLEFISLNPKASLSSIATAMQWKLHNGEPNKVRVGRIIKVLEKAKLVTTSRAGRYQLTDKGKKALKGETEKEEETEEMN